MDSNEISKFFYSDFLMIGTTCVALVLGLKFWKSKKHMRIITIYLIVALVVDIVSGYIELHVKSEFAVLHILPVCLSVYVLTEITTFVIFINRNILDYRLRQTSKFLFVIFLILFFYLVPNKYLPAENQTNSVMVLESLFIVVPCLFYFYEVFKLSTPNLRGNYSFWVITGILFYNACSIPIFLIAKYIEKHISARSYDAVVSFNFILYTCMFLLFIKAYLCKKEAIQ